MSHRKLHTRFRNVVLGIAAVIAAIVAVIVYLSARSYYLSTGEASARAMVSAVEPTIAIGAYARDAVLLKELVDGLIRNPSVARVRVLDAAGGTLASADTPAQATAQPQPQPAAQAQPAAFETALMSPFDAQETSGRLQV